MKSSLLFLYIGAALGCFALSAGQRHHAIKPLRNVVRFAVVKPILEAKCVGCHNDARHPENVNLSTLAKLMKSGEHGKMVVPGHPETSKLYLYVDGEKSPRMPFKQPPLSKAEISTIHQWIATGSH